MQPTWIPKYEQKLAESSQLELLGIPRSWWHVRQGLHPISPERTAIVNADSQREDLDEWTKKLALDKHVRSKAGRTNETAFNGLDVSRRKIELILNMLEPMASAYGDHDRFERWVIQLARREALASSGIGRHVGLIHQFQGYSWPRTTNGFLDWWLFLIPDGGEFDSFDEEPVHVAFAHVFSGDFIKGVFFLSQELRTLELWSRVLRPLGPLDIISLSKMDRYRVAQFLNRRLVEAL